MENRRNQALPSPIRCILPLFFFLLVSVPCPAYQTPAAGACYVYPSPATGDSAWAVYNMPQPGTVRVLVYNEAGDLVADVEDSQPAGVQQTPLDLSHFRKGLYLCRVLLEFTGGTQALKAFKFVVAR